MFSSNRLSDRLVGSRSVGVDKHIIIIIGYISSLVEFVLKLNILPEILEKCWEWAVSTWNWSTDHTSTTRLYSSKQCVEIVRGQRQGLDESLRPHCRGPTPPCAPPPPPTHAISTCTLLSFNSAEHGCDWALDIWRWVQTGDETEVEIVGWDSRKCWHFLNAHSNKWQYNNH